MPNFRFNSFTFLEGKKQNSLKIYKKNCTNKVPKLFSTRQQLNEKEATRLTGFYGMQVQFKTACLKDN